MGFTKWFLKHGFGSIGSSAKAWTKIYLDTITNKSSEITKEIAFQHTILVYTLSNQKVNPYSATEPSLLLDKSESCLAMLMWVLICDIPSLCKSLLVDNKTFDIASQVIYESVMEMASNEIALTPHQFKKKSLEYLDYRDNASRVYNENNKKQDVKYKTIVLDKLNRDSDVFEFIIFKYAKDKFLDLLERYNPLYNVISLIEMNSDKYVYVHYCNETSFQQNLNDTFKRTNGKIRLTYIDG